MVAATNRSQSKKLRDIGIDISTADMVYSKHSISGELEEYELYYNNENTIDDDEIPAWSLGALWNIMHDYKSNFVAPPVSGIESGDLIEMMVSSIVNYKKRKNRK